MTSLLQRIRQRDAAQRRDDGMARSADHAGERWRANALAYLRMYLDKHEFFHVDEFWEWALARGFDEGPSPRSLGPAVRQTSRNGLMIKTSASAPSVRSNLSPKPVWRSNTYRGVRTNTFRGAPIP